MGAVYAQINANALAACQAIAVARVVTARVAGSIPAYFTLLALIGTSPTVSGVRHKVRALGAAARLARLAVWAASTAMTGARLASFAFVA